MNDLKTLSHHVPSISELMELGESALSSMPTIEVLDGWVKTFREAANSEFEKAYARELKFLAKMDVLAKGSQEYRALANAKAACYDEWSAIDDFILQFYGRGLQKLGK